MVNKQYFYCTECGCKLERDFSKACKIDEIIKQVSYPVCTKCGLEFEIEIDSIDLSYTVTIIK